MNNFKKAMLMGAGFLLAGLGMIGIFTPVMPAIPFFIIASVCFSKSSPKFHNLLLNNKFVGPHVREYHEKNGIRLKSKVLFVAVQWGGVALTSLFLIHNLFGRILLIIIGLCVTAYVLSLKTVKE